MFVQSPFFFGGVFFREKEAFSSWRAIVTGNFSVQNFGSVYGCGYLHGDFTGTSP